MGSQHVFTKLDSSLTSSELSAFSADLKGVVWVVQIYTMYKREQTLTYASAFSVDKTGLLMTSAHLFRKGGNHIIMARRMTDDGFIFEADIVVLKSSWEIALLQVRGAPDCICGTLANDGTLVEGQNLFHVGHPGNFVGSFLVGKVVFPCVDDVEPVVGSHICGNYDSSSLKITPRYRVMGDIWYKDFFDSHESKKFLYEKNLHPLIPVIQISGLKSEEGCSGGPIFNARGEIVGMMALGCGGFEIAVHLSLLKQFLKEREEKLQSGNTKRDVFSNIDKGEASKRLKEY